MNKTRIAVLILCGCVVAAYFLSRVPEPPTGIPAMRAAFVENIRMHGGDAAYRAFKKHYLGVPFDLQHNAAHVFGESLYDEEGIAGVRLCDQEFNFGCYHGFFTRAVASEGLDVIGALDRACDASDRPTACQHGIGHGILEYLGHSRLGDALLACKKTHQPDPLAGCTSGVFMEYNVPLSVGGDGTFALQTRPLEHHDEPYHPCTELPDEFRLSCYHELPQWWAQVYGQDFATLGAFCAAAPYPGGGRACFNGLGNVIASFGEYDADTVAGLCRQIADSEGRDSCFINAAWSAFVDRQDARGAAAICAKLPEKLQSECPK